jgi:membrane-associated PAP2 superfamily phosphatase
LIAFAVALAAWALGPASWRARGPRWRRVDAFVVLATLASGPLLISTGKATTNIFCPYQIERYGGQMPYNKLLEPWPEGRKPKQRGRGFPAGHASGGYALLSLAGLAQTARGRRLGLAIGLGPGTAMGGYQMLRGAHYLSHTVISALLCWLVFIFWRRILADRNPAA